MCKLGDIIIIKEFKDEFGEIVSKHSFVVINDEESYIEGFRYDFVSNLMCSFHSEEHRNKKLKYKENLLIDTKQIRGQKINNHQGYIKANQLYYFDKSVINYKVIAHIDSELLDDLVQLILVLYDNDKLRIVTTNLKEEVCNWHVSNDVII